MEHDDERNEIFGAAALCMCTGVGSVGLGDALWSGLDLYCLCTDQRSSVWRPSGCVSACEAECKPEQGDSRSGLGRTVESIWRVCSCVSKLHAGGAAAAAQHQYCKNQSADPAESGAWQQVRAAPSEKNYLERAGEQLKLYQQCRQNPNPGDAEIDYMETTEELFSSMAEWSGKVTDQLVAGNLMVLKADLQTFDQLFKHASQSVQLIGSNGDAGKKQGTPPLNGGNGNLGTKQGISQKDLWDF